MSKYIVIPNIKVINANAQPVWWMISAPPPTAYAGFAHALALKINAKGHEGVAIVHHDIKFLGENFTYFSPNQFMSSGLIDEKDYANGTKMSLSLQPTVRCHVNVSLVIAFNDNVKINPELINKFLRGAHIAGGSIISNEKIVCNVSNHDDAIRVIKKSGDSIIERNDLMQKNEEDRDQIDTLLRVTRRYKDIKPSEPWVVPTCLGYCGISELTRRNKSRDFLPHLYVEPLVGLIQYKSIRETGLHFWRYSNPQKNVFLLTTME